MLTCIRSCVSRATATACAILSSTAYCRSFIMLACTLAPLGGSAVQLWRLIECVCASGSIEDGGATLARIKGEEASRGHDASDQGRRIRQGETHAWQTNSRSVSANVAESTSAHR